MGKIIARYELQPTTAGRTGPWVDMSRDVSQNAGMEAQRGMMGDNPGGQVADTGWLQCSLINNPANSAGLDGYYSPGHSNQRTGFDIEAGFRFSVVVGDGWIDDTWISSNWIAISTATVEWTGHIVRIEPQAGKGTERICNIEARDWIDRLARQNLLATSVQRGINEATAAQAVVDEINVAPRECEVTTGEDTFEFWGDLITEEGTTGGQEMQRICQSSHAFFYMRGDGEGKYEPRNEKRAVFGSPLTVDLALNEDDDLRVADPIFVEDNRQTIYNRIRVLQTQREVGTAAEVVARLTENIKFGTGTTTIILPFTDDEERTVRIGGVEMVNPVQGTDYAFNSESDGSGTDESANVSVTPTFRGASVSLAINNTSGASVWAKTTGNVLLLQVQGVPVTARETLIFESEDTTSTAKGENAFTLNASYQSEPDVSQGLADWYKDTLADEIRKVREVPLFLHVDDTAAAQDVLDLEISSLVTVAETVTAIDATMKFWCQGFRWVVEPNGFIWKRAILMPAHTGPFIEIGSDHLDHGGVASGADDQTTISSKIVTPTGGRAVIVFVAAKRGSSTNPGTPTVSGLGATWTLEDDVVYDGTGVTRRRLWAFSAVEATYTSGKVTIDNFAGTGQAQGRISYSIEHVPTTGTTSATAIVNSATNSGSSVGSLTVTLPAFAHADNRPVKGFALSVDDTMTVESGWTQLGRRNKKTSMLTGVNDDTADTSCVATIPGSAGFVGGVALEIKRD